MVAAYRIANHDTPFWVSPNRSTGRFNRADGGDATQYLSLHPLGCVAEYLRAHDLSSPDDLADRYVRIWVVDVDLAGTGVLTFDTAADHGIAAADLVSDDLRACQRWADRVRADRALPRSWVVPNAALPGTENVVVFGGRVLAPFHLPAIDPEVDLPATIVGDVSLLPSVVVPQTRFRGQRHAAFEAWKRGATYEYREPDRYPFAR